MSPTDLVEVDKKIGEFIDRKAALPSSITRKMVIDILTAYKAWFSWQYDGKKTLGDVCDVFGVTQDTQDVLDQPNTG
jgi:hypothetical protein